MFYDPAMRGTARTGPITWAAEHVTVVYEPPGAGPGPMAGRAAACCAALSSRCRVMPAWRHSSSAARCWPRRPAACNR